MNGMGSLKLGLSHMPVKARWHMSWGSKEIRVTGEHYGNSILRRLVELIAEENFSRTEGEEVSIAPERSHSTSCL